MTSPQRLPKRSSLKRSSKNRSPSSSVRINSLTSLTSSYHHLHGQRKATLNDNDFLLKRGGINNNATISADDDWDTSVTLPVELNINKVLRPHDNYSKVVGSQCNGVLARLLGWPSKEEVTGPETKEQDEKKTPETSVSGDGVVQKWGTEYNVWHSVGPIHSSMSSSSSAQTPIKQDDAGSRSYSGQQQLGAKVEMVYSLLSMLGTHDREKMTTTLLAMSSSPDSCQAMRQSGCVPLLVQLVHAREESTVVRARASQALHNVVHCHADDKRGRREARVLRLLQQLIDFADAALAGADAEADGEAGVKEAEAEVKEAADDAHPAAAIAALMKLSFDEEHRHAMCQLGALHAIATLIQVDAEVHGSDTSGQSCVTVRRYAGMALTNLTFGDSNNKALLCSLQPFMVALVAQLKSPSEDLRQVTASVLRNLSWRADATSKTTLRDVGAVSGLMRAAMQAKKESTLKSILSALWNLSAHCNMNKVEICAVEGALQYLVEMLSFQAPSRTLAIVENAGGILRNISSHVALREDYRAILRAHNCLPLLLQQLQSPSLTVVSNACGALWNLSARCTLDQRALWELGAVPMLRSLVHSKHRMISMGASAALKNLLASRPDADIFDRTSRGMPTLLVRKRRALEQELDCTLSETCDNIESPGRWDSHESVTSTHSENTFDRMSRSHHCQRSGSLQLMKRSGSNASTPTDGNRDQNQLESQMQRLKLNESALSSVASSGNSLYNTNNSTSITNSSANSDATTNRCTDKPSTKPDLVESTTPEEKPVDYSCSKEDRGDEKKSTSLERRKLAQREGEKSVKSRPNSSSGQLPSEEDRLIAEEDHLIAEEDVDMPTDYSLKYHEGGDNKAREELDDRYQKQADYNLMVRYRSCKSPEGVSAEAELDQPTDYSLKYRESGGHEGEKRNCVDNRHEIIENSGHYAETDLDEALDYYTEDKVQTYCTEGTPYAFSNATSMSDLRVSENNETPAEKITTVEAALDQPTDYSFKYRENSEGEKETESVGCHDNETSGHYAETDLDEALDYYTEDKVQTYCTEGTPYAFSNATSMSDLRVSEANEPTPEKLPKEERVDGVKKASTPVGSPANGSQAAESQQTANITPKEENRENKGATLETPLMFSRSSSLGSLSNCEPPDGSVGCEFSRFTSGVVSPYDLPESPLQTGPSSPRNIKPSPQQPAGGGKVVTFETPLMFSRCSSLGSLSSCEPPDSSVVSEFSRFASGVISPTELPDSPTQTGPPSPRHVKPMPQPTAVGKGVATANGHPSSVFEDTVAAFKEESTPQHFSTGTSLSSLTFDDEPTPLQQQMIKQQQQRINNTSNSSSSVAPNSTSSSSAAGNDANMKAEVDPAVLALAPVSEEEDEDDMLAACINIGMQNSNRQRSSHISKPTPLSRLPKPRHSGIPVKAAAGITPPGHHQPSSFNQRKLHNPQHQLIIDSEVNEDSTTEFCTEGTPANISHATSHSDLSMLCASSDDDHDNNMVAECIRSAMPQARNSKSAVKIEQLSVSNKQTNEKQKEIIDTRVKMRTPKSSPQQQTPIAYNSPRVKDIKLECFAVEGSPGVFSTRSSLSDLTINSVPKSRERCPVSPAPDDGLSPLSSLEPEVTVLSRQPSTGSLDGDWTEEQALLQQCISSGMPPPSQPPLSQPPPAKNGLRPPVAVTAPGTVNTVTVAATPTHTQPTSARHQQNQQQTATVDRMKESVDTWNDDTSPNDVSFPSISVTTPLISSYKSALGDADDDEADDRTEADAYVSLPVSTVTRGLEEMSLTDSSIIQLEEGKVAIIANMEMEASYLSDLDSVRPPSAMGSLLSLTQSMSVSEADRRANQSVSMSEADRRGGRGPMRGLVARRALADSSLSWNNIDSIKPPSGMDELLDLENSILSVASITSEIADSPHSCSEDVTLAETLDSNLDLPQSPQPQKRITPKQKRQNVKDRYNTYTINPDHLQNGVTSEATEPVTSSQPDDADDVIMASSPKVQRMTPKQRRLADKERFMTRTLGVEGVEQMGVEGMEQMVVEGMEQLSLEVEGVEQMGVEGIVTSTGVSPPSPPATPRDSLKSVDSADELISGDEEEDGAEVEKAKPRVVKPSGAQSMAEVKAIRGRKKVRSGIPISAKVSPAPPVPPVTKKTANSAIPAPSPPVLQRQGTFTKDEPTTPPPSGIPVLSKKASPIRTLVKKKGTAATPQNSKTPTQSSKTPAAVRYLAGRGRAGSLPRSEPPKKPALGVRSSVSNQSLKSETLKSEASDSAAGPGSDSSPSQSRWSSNSNLAARKDANKVSDSSLTRQRLGSGESSPRWSSNSNLVAKKDATSKIASLWKKVEDSKRKDTVGKDTRVWIAAPSKQAA
ncbi:adenomatous polyposis coli protein [Nilaparvata lugens]|uniref:adenomatous polyposis coli protein n=1 Tax=Nilaparvata lugens TaxID=108931 RepID=UPI00193E97F6|nr:adenomatous polyposis coli protein [Nilaparvata lugens]